MRLPRSFGVGAGGSVCPKHKLAPLKTPLDRFRVTPNYIPSINSLISEFTPYLDVLTIGGKMLPGDVLHQSRHAHPAFPEHADDAVEGVARAAAEEHGLAVFNGRNGEERILVFLQ